MISDEATKIKSTLVRDTWDETPIPEKRRIWEESVPRLHSLSQNVRLEHQTFGGVDCLLHTPTDAEAPNRLILYIHGGGLVEGSVITSREWCVRLALVTKLPVLSIDYRLAPEHPYPAALEDVIAVYGAIVKNTEMSITSVGADSTGCTLALQLLIHLRNGTIQSPASCFLLSPSIDLSLSGLSIKTNADLDPIVSEEVLARCAKLYADGVPLDSPQLSPLFSELHDLPPILVHVDEAELLLDDTLRLADKIRNVEGQICIIVSRGLWHVWPTWGDFPESRLAAQQISDHIHRE